MKYIGIGKHIQKNGGVGSHGHCVIELEGIGGNEVVFENRITGGAIPKEFIPAIEQGIKEACKEGHYGHAMIGVKFTLIDGSYHDIDSSINDFKIAGKKAAKDAFMKADVVLLEPYAAMNVTVPKEYIGAVVGDLNKRRAKLKDIGEDYIDAEVPIAESFGYLTALRNLTQGRASFSSSPCGYEEVPPNLVKELV